MTVRVIATRTDGGNDIRLVVYPPEGDAVAAVMPPRQALALAADLMTILAGTPERALEPAQPTLWGAARWGENTDLG